MSPRIDPADPHRRARHALVDRHAGMLEESEQVWFDEHLANCDACRAMAELMVSERDTIVTAGEHLPASLMARWTKEYPRLPELIRESADRHVQECSECRRGLELLGHTIVVPATAPVVRARATAPVSFLDRIMSAIPRLAPAGGLATAVLAVVLMVNPTARQFVFGGGDAVPGRVTPGGNDPAMPPVASDPVPQETPPSTTGGTTGAPVRPPAAVATEPQLLAWSGSPAPATGGYAALTLDDPRMRGAGTADTLPAQTVVAGTRTLQLKHPEAVFLRAVGDFRVNITIVTPSGVTLTHRTTGEALRPDRPLRLDLPAGVEPGTYRYRYEFAPEAHEPPLQGEIRIVVR